MRSQVSTLEQGRSILQCLGLSALQFAWRFTGRAVTMVAQPLT